MASLAISFDVGSAATLAPTVAVAATPAVTPTPVVSPTPAFPLLPDVQRAIPVPTSEASATPKIDAAPRWSKPKP
jgi:hypothetical protein